ncbi:MAG: hypothetical protein Q8O09_03570 [Bacillota bacterium]|nr:hypothetical protein [Bacillota bacterium]
MGYLSEKVAYLRGLVDGTKHKQDAKENKITLGILELLDDMAEAIEQLKSSQDEMDRFMESIDQDLSDLECELLGEGEAEKLQVECPKCHEVVDIDTVAIENDENILCPKCNEKINNQPEATVS